MNLEEIPDVSPRLSAEKAERSELPGVSRASVAGWLPRGEAGVGRRLGDLDPVPAGAFRRVQGGVGAGDQLVGGLERVPCGHAGRERLPGGGYRPESLDHGCRLMEWPAERRRRENARRPAGR